MRNDTGMKEKEPIISKSTLGNRQERVVGDGVGVVLASHDSSWREQCQVIFLSLSYNISQFFLLESIVKTNCLIFQLKTLVISQMSLQDIQQHLKLCSVLHILRYKVRNLYINSTFLHRPYSLCYMLCCIALWHTV